jgi:hypothetical protein
MGGKAKSRCCMLYVVCCMMYVKGKQIVNSFRHIMKLEKYDPTGVIITKPQKIVFFCF